MAKCPYRFPARSRVAMIAALENVGGYSGWNAPGRRAWPFAWNVKVYHRSGDETAATLNAYHPEAETFDSALDSAFDSMLQKDDSAFWGVVEQMRQSVEDWSDYDGNDSFEFEYAGRSGGHLVMTRGPDGQLLQGLDFDDMRADVEEWPFADVRKLYRSVMVADSDFSDSKVRAEYLYQMAHYRNQWEIDQRDEREAGERAMIAEAFRGEMGL